MDRHTKLRLIAYIIDGIIPMTIMYSIFFIILALPQDFLNQNSSNLATFLVLLIFLTKIILDTTLIIIRGATIGKKTVGLKIINNLENSKLPIYKAIGRELTKSIFYNLVGIIVFIDFVLIYRDKLSIADRLWKVKVIQNEVITRDLIIKKSIKILGTCFLIALLATGLYLWKFQNYL